MLMTVKKRHHHAKKQVINETKEAVNIRKVKAKLCAVVQI